MLLGVAWLTILLTATPVLSTPLSSEASSTPAFIPFPSVQLSPPIVLTTGTQAITVPQPFQTSLGSLQPSIGLPTSVLGSFAPGIGTTVTALGSFQPSIGSPITSLGSFAPSSGVPLATLGSFQPGIGSPTTMLGSFQPGIGARQPNIPVTVASAGNLSSMINVVNGVLVPPTPTAINLALTNGQLTVLNSSDSFSANILNPEPSSFLLFGTALGGLALFKWWSRRISNASKYSGLTLVILSVVTVNGAATATHQRIQRFGDSAVQGFNSRLMESAVQRFDSRMRNSLAQRFESTMPSSPVQGFNSHMLNSAIQPFESRMMYSPTQKPFRALSLWLYPLYVPIQLVPATAQETVQEMESPPESASRSTAPPQFISLHCGAFAEMTVGESEILSEKEEAPCTSAE